MSHGDVYLDEFIASLKVSVEFGADEALNKKPRNRLGEQPFKNRNESSKQHQTTYVEKNSLQKSITPHDEIEIAQQLANKCKSVSEIKTELKNFPYFMKNYEMENVTFYDGPEDPSVIIFKEPEIYFKQAEKDGNLFDGNLLFNRILKSVDKVLGATTKSFCGSVVTYPQHWDNSEENKSLNARLLQPFLFRHIDLLKPKVVICQGGAWLSHPTDKGFKNKDLEHDVLVIDFPSLDVLRRAPKRKKEVWRKILELKKFF